MRWLAVSSLVLLISNVYADGGLYPPGLLPLINRANSLLSTGQFNEAARIYSEAIEQSPADYLLYYKRATAYFSLSRHGPALDDFDKVLSLTSDTFDNAYFMKARLHIKDGHFSQARESLQRFISKNKGDVAAVDLMKELTEGETITKKVEQERKAHLWNACVESASAALKTASHSVELRQMRAECSLAAGDFEGAVGDLTRLTHLLPPSTSLQTRIFRLDYFFLPSSPAGINALKQCLHYDPDSKTCLSLHRIAKGLDKGIAKLDELLSNEDWRGIITLLTGSGKTNDLMKRFDDAMNVNTAREQLLPSPSSSKDMPIPLPNPTKFSPRRQTLVRSLCKAYVKSNSRKADQWCEQLLTMDGCSDDVDGLLGRGEALLRSEEWEDAVRAFERAFEASGRSDRDIHSRLQKAQRLLKQSKQKDYYKVLDVDRSADQKTIKKAFRKAALKAHPDKGGSEAKMASVNEAYEVLSDPELRARFDNGEDPNDPMAQQGGHPFANGQHPFAQFFQQSSGGFSGGGGGHQHGGFQFHFGH
ncbi:hypothetical protein EV421DRAFT_1786383 [Armillaria borealis]|uniref:J domain-containing protein n=1 Tax=Armillaria borealis TaxID=47425 RepID=A0AA39JX45_9AGAR|nr:hypothetical protein EV421DRAFT_1786383 [Armillaria borealis]